MQRVTSRSILTAAAMLTLASSVYAGTSTNTAGPTRQGTDPAVTISFSGQAALRAFASGRGISALQPGTSATFFFGPAGTPVTYYAPADGSTYVQLASPNFTSADIGIGGNSFATVPTNQQQSALRVEWHEQGSVQGLVDLINDQIGYTGPATTGYLSNLASRGPSSGNPTWINTNKFTGANTLGGHTLAGANYANTYDPAVYNLATGQNIAGGQNRIQYSQGEFRTENFSVAGTASSTALPGQAGFGRGNPALLPSAAVSGIGTAGGRQQFQPETIANQSTDKVNPESTTGQAYAAGPWNTAGANNIDSKQFAVTAVGFAANPGTGLKQIVGQDAKWLQATGRLQNGANFNVVSRANDAGQRTVPAISVGLDPSWAVGENDDGNTSGSTAQAAQRSVGAGFRFSGKTSGGDASVAVAQSRLGIGALSISDARGASSTAPIRLLDVDFNHTADTGNLADYTRINYDNIINFNYKAILISHINTVKAANVPLLNSYRAQFQTDNGRAPTTAEEQTWWNGLSSDQTGIKGDQFGNVKAFVGNITNSVGSAAAGISATSANNPADALFSAGYTIPGLLNFKREVDGGAVTPNVLNAQQLAVQGNIRDNYGPLFLADGSSADINQTKGSGAYYTAQNTNGAVLNGTTADLLITTKDAAGNNVANGTDTPKGNWLFGNFNQDGRRDFASVKESVNAALSLNAVDRLTASGKNSIYTADGGVGNSTVIPSLTGTPGWATTAKTKGDLVILGDFNTDGKFDGADVDLLARGASLSDNGSTDHLTTASGATFSQQLRNANAKLNKNAALDYIKSATANVSNVEQTFLRKSAQTAQQAANDPTGANAFNKFDVNRDGLVNRQDAAIVDGFVGKDYRNLDDQLNAVVATNINTAGTVFKGNPLTDQTTARRSFNLVDAELNDTGDISYQSDFKLIHDDLVGSGKLLDGDANLDGAVDFNDFLDLQNNFGQLATKFSQGNFNFDGTTDFNDFLVLQNNFGQSVTGVPVQFTQAQIAAITAFGLSVPEPTSLAIIGLGAMTAMRRRRLQLAQSDIA